MKLEDGVLKTTSLSVATHFRKKHKNVLQKIEAMYNQEFNRLNFQPVSYADSHGQSRPMFKMTRDGWMLLVMAFTGKKAEDAKIWFIGRFNEMEAQLLGASPLAKFRAPDMSSLTY